MSNITTISAIQDNLTDVSRALVEARSRTSGTQEELAAKDKLISELEAAHTILEKALVNCRIRREYLID
jgi:hypothetical protein